MKLGRQSLCLWWVLGWGEPKFVTNYRSQLLLTIKIDLLIFYAENPPKQNKRIELSPISLKYFHDEQNLSSTNLNTIILLVVIQFKFLLSSCYLVTYQNYDDASSRTLCYGLLLELHNLMEMYQISDSNSLMHDLFVRITAEFI